MASQNAKTESKSLDQDKNLITLQNQKNSPLLRLPGEILNQIYKYAGGPTMYAVDVRAIDKSMIDRGDWDSVARALPSGPRVLTQVCRKTRADTKNMSYPHYYQFRGDSFTLSEFFDALSPSQKSKIYNINLITDTNDWSLTEWSDHRVELYYDHDENLDAYEQDEEPDIYIQDDLCRFIDELSSLPQLERITLEWAYTVDDDLITQPNAIAAIEAALYSITEDSAVEIEWANLHLSSLL